MYQFEYYLSIAMKKVYPEIAGLLGLFLWCIGLSWLLFSSCSNQEEGDLPSGNVTLGLQLDYGDAVQMDSGKIRYIVRAYPRVDGKRADYYSNELFLIKELTEGYDCQVAMDLAPGDYEVVVWSDLVEDDTVAPYHNADDFGEIRLQGNHAGSNDFRAAYRGATQVVLEENASQHQLEVEMQSPLAKFELIANDLLQFAANEAARTSAGVNLDDYVAEFQYVGYVPDTYSLFTDKPVDSATGVTFRSSLTQLTDTEASLGFDYVFVNNKESVVTVRIAIYGPCEELVASTGSIKVPLKRGEHTVMRGTYLGKKSSGGIQVNPGYDGDFNLTLP